MNIKIDKETALYLLRKAEDTVEFGSGMYDCKTSDSDTDIMVFLDELEGEDLLDIYNVHHQLQWDDEDNNIDYIFTTKKQFFRNLLSGDSTINAEILIAMGSDEEMEVIDTLYSYKTIRAFLGFAKRDLKEHKKGNKKFHVMKGLYIADMLMKKRLPKAKTIARLFKTFKEDFDYLTMQKKEKDLRERLNRLYDADKIKTYGVLPDVTGIFEGEESQIIKLLVDSMNTKEFRY